MSERLFAEHGSDAFNVWMGERVAAIVADVQRALGDNLVALILGGGYARGEGGVVEVDGEERPYNDLDFVLVVNRKSAEIPTLLAPISKRHGELVGIDVDFSRPLTLSDIRAWPHWLMWTDLLLAHRVVHGPANILNDHAPKVVRESPPLIEATRLLLNRGAGLLWSLRIARGLEKAHDPDFLRRNRHKCELAIGDASILVHRRHVVRYDGRVSVLRQILESDAEAAGFASVKTYREALEFRLRPGRSEDAQPTEKELQETAERWVRALVYTESRRTGISFASVEDYTRWKGVREPERNGAPNLAKNLLRNLRLGSFSLRYPREQLYRVLPRLLLQQDADWDGASERFLTVWRRYN